jgi:alpha-1,6-mannosyltransferase
MNDLAEKALRGLDAARKQLRDRPMLCFAVLGFAIASVVVVAGGRVGAARSTRPLTTWLGLQDSHGLTPGDNLPGAVMLAAIVALVLLWLLTVEIVRRTRPPDSRVWWVAAAWITPFAVGPPLMDTSVHTYVAYGLLQRAGRDPYTSSPSLLGDSPIVAAIDPGARGVPSSAGPLGTVLQHLSVSISGGSALGAVIVVRVVCLLAVIWIGRLAADLGGSHRAEALSLCVLNPLVLLYFVSSPHLDAVMIAFVLASLSAANQHRWLTAVALAGVAGSVSAQGFIAVPIIITVHWLSRRTVPAWRLIGRDLLVAAGTISACGLIQPGGFGWLWTVSKQFTTHTPFAVASAIGEVLAPIVRAASFDDLAASGRITAMTAAVCTIIYLIITARRRALERTTGYALLALGLLAPSLNPWYVLWGALCLAPTANGPRRIWVLALSAAACVLTPPGFSRLLTNGITAVALVVTAAITIVLLTVDARRTSAEPATVSAEN